MTNILDRSDDLDRKLSKATGINQAIESLIKDARRRRHQMIILAISVVLDILVSMGLFLGWQQNHKIALQAETNHAAIVRNCETSNEARAKNREIWNYVLEISNRPNQTPEQLAARDKFVAKLNETFAPRDCAAIK